jgi:hypothetical protein
MRKTVLLLACVTLALSTAALADVEEDKVAIRQAALDYIEGWYAGDAARVERAVHPDLAKRIVVEENGRSRLQPMSAMGLVQAVRTGWGTRTPADQQQKDVEILDVFGNAATVKVIARDWVDYLHIARFDGRWVIVNVLWAYKPEALAGRAQR